MKKIKLVAFAIAISSIVASGILHAQAQSVPPEDQTYESTQLGDYSPSSRIPIAAPGQEDKIIGYSLYEDIYGEPSNVITVNADGELGAPATAPVYDYENDRLIGLIGAKGFTYLGDAIDDCLPGEKGCSQEP